MLGPRIESCWKRAREATSLWQDLSIESWRHRHVEGIGKGITLGRQHARAWKMSKNATECELAWSNEWWDGLAPRLLHPDTVYGGREVLASLERLSIAGVGDGCHEDTLKSMRLKGVFTRDADYVNEAINELMRQTDQPIREILTESLAQ
jgi:hypothetical protein